MILKSVVWRIQFCSLWSRDKAQCWARCDSTHSCNPKTPATRHRRRDRDRHFPVTNTPSSLAYVAMNSRTTEDKDRSLKFFIIIHAHILTCLCMHQNIKYKNYGILIHCHSTQPHDKLLIQTQEHTLDPCICMKLWEGQIQPTIAKGTPVFAGSGIWAVW